MINEGQFNAMDFGMIETMQGLHDTLVYAKIPPKVHAAFMLPVIEAWKDNGEVKRQRRWPGDDFWGPGCEFWVRHPDRQTTVWKIEALRNELEYCLINVQRHRVKESGVYKSIYHRHEPSRYEPGQLIPLSSSPENPYPPRSDNSIFFKRVMYGRIHAVLIDSLLEGRGCC